MTKSEILDRLKWNRDYNPMFGTCHFRDSEPWRDAFTYYNAVHGLSGKEAMRMNCTKCFEEVRDWLLIKEK